MVLLQQLQNRQSPPAAMAPAAESLRVQAPQTTLRRMLLPVSLVACCRTAA